jgi:HEAT repeat protein
VQTKETTLNAGEDTALALQNVKTATDVAVGMARAYKNLHFYGENNPVPRESAEIAFSALTSYLDANETLTYTLTETELLYRGKPVYTNPDRRGSFVFKLFRDGVRAVSFHRGIMVDDLIWLLDALSRANADKEDVESDVVTQIWERELAHITYIAVDDYLEFDSDEDEESKPGEEGETPPTYAHAPIPSEPQQEEAYGLARVPESLVTEKERLDILNLELSEEELGEIGHQILAEERGDPRVKVTEIFLEVVSTHPDTTIGLDVARVLPVLCTDFLEEGKPAEAARLLSEVKRILADQNNLPQEVRKVVEEFIESRGMETELSFLESRIEEAAVTTLVGYEQYLNELNSSSVMSLCAMLGRLRSKRARDMLCRVLSVLARNNLNALLEYVTDPRWYLVRNVVYVLRLMKEKQVTARLEHLTVHEDLRVRTEVIHCLAEIGGEEAQVAMARFLNDSEKSLRILAAKKLGQSGGSRAVSLIGECISQDSFLARSFDEKCELFEALGRTGQDEVVSILENLIKKRSLFNWGPTNEMKLCALSALGRMGTSRALGVLERTARQTRGSLRRACLDAMRLCNLGISKSGSHERLNSKN